MFSGCFWVALVFLDVLDVICFFLGCSSFWGFLRVFCGAFLLFFGVFFVF